MSSADQDLSECQCETCVENRFEQMEEQIRRLQRENDMLYAQFRELTAGGNLDAQALIAFVRGIK